MNETIQRKLDELGRIVLPIEMRQALALKEKSVINLRCEGRKITLENADTCCKLCNSSQGELVSSGSDYFCPVCIARIKAL